MKEEDKGQRTIPGSLLPRESAAGMSQLPSGASRAWNHSSVVSRVSGTEKTFRKYLPICSLIFIISFLLLILNFGCYFTNSFMWWVRLFIWDFPYFLKKACFAMNFPLRTAFAASHRFNMVHFHCHLPQGIFKFLLWFTIDPLAFLVACCLVSM